MAVKGTEIEGRMARLNHVPHNLKNRWIACLRFPAERFDRALRIVASKR
jgi:hypothetical protein